MTTCEWCGKETYLPFICSYCKGKFCEEHRIPEFHNCSYPKNLRFKPSLNKGEFWQRTIIQSQKTDTRIYNRSKHKKAKNFIKLLSVICIIICLYGILTYIYPISYQDILQFFQPKKLEDVKKEIFNLINEKRAANGLPELSNDSLLTITAQSWSENMAKNTKLEHGNFGVRMNQIGYLNNYMCGEIIEYYSGSYDLAKILVDGWINSPPHKEIMFTAKNGKMGIGLAKGNDGYYATVDFIFW